MSRVFGVVLEFQNGGVVGTWKWNTGIPLKLHILTYCTSVQLLYVYELIHG